MRAYSMDLRERANLPKADRGPPLHSRQSDNRHHRDIADRQRVVLTNAATTFGIAATAVPHSHEKRCNARVGDRTAGPGLAAQPPHGDPACHESTPFLVETLYGS